jgi:hypothetical protein
VVDTEESYVTQKDVATLGVGEQDSIAAASAALGARPNVATKTSDNVPQLIDACRSLTERRGSWGDAVPDGGDDTKKSQGPRRSIHAGLGTTT